MPERERVKDHNAKDARRRLYAYLLNREEVVFEEWRREYAYKVLAINPIFEKLYAAYEAAAEATAFASSEQQSSSSFERRYYPYYIVYAINPIFEELYAAYAYYYVAAEATTAFEERRCAVRRALLREERRAREERERAAREAERLEERREQRYLSTFSHFHFYLPRTVLGRLQPGPRAEPRRVIMGVAETRRCVLSRMAWLPERQDFSAFFRALLAIFRALAV